MNTTDTMIYNGLCMLLCLLSAVAQLSNTAVMRVHYVNDFFYQLHFKAEMLNSLIANLSANSTSKCELAMTPKGHHLVLDVTDVRCNASTARTQKPKYNCAYHKTNNIILCDRVKQMVACPKILRTDLFGIKWDYEQEYLSGTRLFNSSHNCLGEYGSKWKIVYYSHVTSPNSFRHSNSPTSGSGLPPDTETENALQVPTGVETSSLKTIATTENVESAGNVSVIVIVICSVLGAVVIIVAIILIYCLVCRGRRRRQATVNKKIKYNSPRYEDVIIPVDATESVNSRFQVNADNNFTGISNIYSYPYPACRNNGGNSHCNSGGRSQANSVSEYSNPVDQYMELEESQYSLDNQRNILLALNRSPSGYCRPADSYDVPKSRNSLSCENHNAHQETTHLPDSNLKEPPISDSKECVSEPAVISDRKSGQTRSPNVIDTKITPGKSSESFRPISNKRSGESGQYSKLGEEERILLHNYDQLSQEKKEKNSIYSLL